MRVRFCSILLSAALFSGGAFAEETAAAPNAANVRLQAVVATGAKPLAEPLSWVVTRLSEAGGTPGEVVATPKGASPKLSLAPGRYIVSVTHGEAEAREKIVVGPSDANHVLNLNAGYIRLDMIPHAGAPAVNNNITWEVYQYVKGGGVDESRKMAVAVAPTQRFLLPAGYYIVRARYDGTTADMVLPVTAGHQFSYTLNLYAGKVGLSAVADKGAVKDDVTWEIRRAAPGEDGSREVVATHVGTAPTVLLREGKYIVQARSGDLVGEAPLEIKAGNLQKVKVKLKAGAANG